MVIALDAVSPDLVGEMIADGELPALARMFREGAVAPTMAAEGVFVSANWPTLFTALEPDRHGYRCWNEIVGGTYEYRETSIHEVGGRPLWEHLSDAGHRVAVLDVPHSVVRPVNGVMISEFACHDRHLGTTSWPPELADELKTRYGTPINATNPRAEPQFSPCDYALRAGEQRTAEETVAMFGALCEEIEIKRAAALELLDRGGWDLFLNVLSQGHCVGHQMWHLHDPEHDHHDAALTARLGGSPVCEIYRRLDRVLGQHLERVSPDDTVYVLFPHGMEAHHDGTHLIDHILHRLDWSLDHADERGAASRVAARLTGRLPAALRRHGLRALALASRRAGNPGEPEQLPPLAQRRWFAQHNNTVVGAVRLNLAGREPAGRVDPADRHEVLEWLTERLLELVNVDTGQPVVDRCVIAEDVYERRPDDSFGDLYVHWNRATVIERVWSPAVGSLRIPYTHWRQGDHSPEGLMLGIGPGLRPGMIASAEGERRPIVDAGATIAAALGTELPDVDGRPILELLPEDARAISAARPQHPRRRRGRARTCAAPAWARRDVAGLTAVRSHADGAATAAASARQEAQDAGDVARAARDAAAGAQAEARAARDAADAGRVTLVERIAQLERDASLAAMAAWLRGVEVAEDLLVSVVLPTRNRRVLLESAVESVIAQSYGRWELLIVDDGSTDGTGEYLAGLTDARIRVLGSEPRGVCAARNLALDEARGDFVAYLDDDNRLDLDWLKAIAFTLAALPETSLLYGARVVDDRGRLLRGVPDGKPWTHFWSWSRAALELNNHVDMGAIAHRRGDGRFDPKLAYFGDWDLLLKLSADANPVEVPAVALYYRTDSPGRISATLSEAAIEAEYQRVRSRVAQRALGHEPRRDPGRRSPHDLA